MPVWPGHLRGQSVRIHDAIPRFVVARDWVTPVALLVFGVALAGGCRLFAQSSMKPKVEAAWRFAMHGGTAAVGAIDQAAPTREGKAGTRIEQEVPECTVPEWAAHECTHHSRTRSTC
jgi:hypothetical protein